MATTQGTSQKIQAASVYDNTNGMPTAGGKSLHMETGPGDMANRIITVGSLGRLERMLKHFDEDKEVKRFESSRGFTTVTGTFNGVPLSIVSIGMGTPNMDFFVRETRLVIDGPAAMVRFGTCGGLGPIAEAGSIVVASKGSGCINRNFDAFFEESKDSPYVCTRIAPANADLSALLSEKIGQNLGEDVVVEGCNVTADSFYSTQGRQDPHFDDQNEGVIAHIKNTYPEVRSMEMETFQLFHMAMCAKASHSIAAAAAAIVVAHRETGQVVDGDTLSRLESEGGRSIMQAITSLDL